MTELLATGGGWAYSRGACSTGGSCNRGSCNRGSCSRGWTLATPGTWSSCVRLPSPPLSSPFSLSCCPSLLPPSLSSSPGSLLPSFPPPLSLSLPPPHLPNSHSQGAWHKGSAGSLHHLRIIKTHYLRLSSRMCPPPCARKSSH